MVFMLLPPYAGYTPDDFRPNSGLDLPSPTTGDAQVWASLISNHIYQTCLICVIPGQVASSGISAKVKSEQIGKRHQLDVAHLAANMVMNINKTVPRAKRNIKNEDHLMEL